ncbi:unnamed protein product [Protopolystoma xenopodis]|uniref:Uncharacterized protein n=1 Tax=Protopolystoma xenopodis TaxID=117903 RepID=A0A3S5FGR6_9PLAT|nr:unnamed protein product [Protopolystoma xenopodis]
MALKISPPRPVCPCVIRRLCRIAKRHSVRLSVCTSTHSAPAGQSTVRPLLHFTASRSAEQTDVWLTSCR